MSTIEKIKRVAKRHNLDVSKYDPDELIAGIKVEREHNKNPKTDVVGSFVDLIRIAMAHLEELPDYYTRLAKMEKEEIKVRELVRRTMEEMT